MNNKFKRIAVITGATSGIGEATARRLIAAGMGVVGNGRNEKKMALLEKEFGPSFCGVVGDATDVSVLDAILSKAGDHFEKPTDLVVANAGRGLGGTVTNADLSQFEDLLKINVTGTLALLQKAALNLLELKKSGGTENPIDIVIIGSVVGRHVSPFSAAYAASKFAVHALAESLRREVGPEGIRVSLVEPGMVKSGFQTVAGYSDEMVKNLENKYGPLLIGDDIANAIHYIVTQPPHVHISSIAVRPTRQDYP
ncbi:SDR family oxidoreductase [uncultured Desulfosarcina sp.]|uniref:SDR family oxidoreductase n=1 Tax=uncultured Desulfosarcina sp. TaxID=218289 RepID=UPI0029C85CBB|nr:SDR family oxidoreductase [uncultured Desulfosarcina sp.]